MRKLPVLLLLVIFIVSGSLGFTNLAAASESQVNSLATFSQLNLYPNIETIGVVVSGAGLPKKADLMYRLSGEANWRSGHPLVRIDDGRLVGSLFGLSPSTPYQVKVIDAGVEISGSIITQAVDLQFNPSVILHVNDDAPAGGNGSVAAPFKTIQEGINRAVPGTQILVADGIYREAVTFPASGSPGNWIQVKAEGSGAILDSSETLSGSAWTPYQDKRRVWSTNIGSLLGYLARDQKRFYNYDSLSKLIAATGHNNVTINEGWYLDPNTFKLYIRSLDDPSNHVWQVPRQLHAFDVNGRDWIWIEGFEMRYYNRCGVCALNASHLVIRRNRIHNIQLGIFFDWTGGDTRGNDTRVEYNEIYDPPVNEWPWSAVKGTSMEGTAIVVRGHIGAIVRNNDIHNYFNGIYTGSSGALENSALAFDVDIYNNKIHQISDDALEPEGACINHRFRNNTIDRVLVGVSLAPVTQGPVWVLRSTVSNYTARAIKWDRNSDGIALFYHNTFWSDVKDSIAMEFISPVSNAVMRNNILQSGSYVIYEVKTGSSGHDWNNDNLYTTRTADANHFKWENILYNSVEKLCAASGLECNGYESPPGLTNPIGGIFTLIPSSPNLDRGAAIPGINDQFSGAAPDVGAFERASDSLPAVVSIARTDANPTTAELVRFAVTFSEPVSGVDAGDFVTITTDNLSGASIVGLSGSANSYTVTVADGNGVGSLRLDLVDNDSIVDVSGTPLGGAGAGNGNFINGEAYTVNRPPVTILSEVFRSNAANDGWVLESNETSNKGGSKNSNATTFNLGDDSKDRMYRAVLHFPTISLPDNAVVTQVILMIKKQGAAGADPFITHQNILIDIRGGVFGSFGPIKIGALQVSDFQAPADKYSVGVIRNNPVSGWYWSVLDAAAFPHINRVGVTQLRLGFQIDDNDNRENDFLKFFSGNAGSAEDRPQLLVKYYVP
ncbi:MAG: right-handed parallel beta-helix repeat-containing protein [Chloroflexi bacterium]|nr:right-handed parallel beta-helix repeat-containing protein [Chloroflexota bacterium]